nr:reverse transcriptase domain-containing protein [Tanacetum cinerariifolium]
MRYGSPLIVYRLKSYRECMRTRSNFYQSNSTAKIPRRSNRRRIPNIVEPELRTIEEIIPMADRTMEELLQAPTEGNGEAIVILKILAENFEIKTNLLHEVWDRFKELLRACPHNGFSELTQIDTFYNGLTEQDHDSLNAASGGNLINKTTREALQIIENKSKRTETAAATCVAWLPRQSWYTMKQRVISDRCYHRLK